MAGSFHNKPSGLLGNLASPMSLHGRHDPDSNGVPPFSFLTPLLPLWKPVSLIFFFFLWDWG
jgi:hypothetical protein